MTGFKASNGWHIDGDGDLWSSLGELVLLDSHIAHVRRFFLEERDHELGRWRSKADPSWTAVRDGEFVYFQNEDGKRSFSFNADETTDYRWSGDLIEIAREYFATHPQHKPLPEAKGLYVNATYAREFPHNTAVLTRDYEGWHHYGDPRTDAERTAQQWHDAGELVRLVPEGSGDE
ncbi:hypothetical protein ACSAGD_10600 [Paramicrobacterium sp. CJ85]|uniref:hypothetical protein n=1 Tax=Paramicrobacterium sp. CJ85 TaxID=3445355 RepID=UPI003F612B6E